MDRCISPKEKEAADKKTAKTILLADAAADVLDAANATADVGAAGDGTIVEEVVVVVLAGGRIPEVMRTEGGAFACRFLIRVWVIVLSLCCVVVIV